jgi:hypothetical protein
VPNKHPALETANDVKRQRQKELFHRKLKLKAFSEDSGLSRKGLIHTLFLGTIFAVKFCSLEFAEPPTAYYGVPMKTSIGRIAFLAAIFLLVAPVSRADQIVMQNGDILNGKVLTMTTNTLVLQNENLGTVTLPRMKVSNITFGMVMMKVPAAVAPTANAIATPQPAGVATNSMSDLQAMLRGIRDQSNLVQQVEAQVLGSSASPEAVKKFNDLLDGLSTGKIDMNGLRAEAQSAASQLQEYKKEMGPEAGGEIDSYLTILNNFLQETGQANYATNSAVP